MNSMFNAMNTVATDTWNLMATGISFSIGPNEETLTDLNLIKLCSSVPSLRVTKFNKTTEEPRNGADWEWWIGSSRDNRWIQLRVQAKRSSHSGYAYDQLIHSGKARDEDGKVIDPTIIIKQYDILIAQSLRAGAVPLHAFYNGWPADRFKFGGKHHDGIAKFRRAARDGSLPSIAWDAANWGCTIAHTPWVKKIFEDPTLSDFPQNLLSTNQAKNNRYVPLYLTHSSPWSHILYSRTPGTEPSVAEIAQNIRLITDGFDEPLSPQEFEAMTHANPSPDAQIVAFGAQFFQKSAKLLAKQRDREEQSRQDTADFLDTLSYTHNLDHLLESQASDQPRAQYLMVLDLHPEYADTITDVDGWND